MTNKLNNQDKEFIINNYPYKGMNYCINNLNKNRWQIADFCRDNNIKCNLECIINVNKEGQNKSKITKSKKIWKHKIDEKQFLDIKTPEIAYLLGFIWADGYLSRIHTIGISCLSTDMNNIENIFQKTGEWNKTIRNRPNRKQITTFYTSNKELVNFLKENDYHAKSEESADKILSRIPNNLKRYWLLGLIDGDGCFYRGKYAKQFSIGSSYNQKWNYIINIFKQLDINKFKIKKVIQKNEKHKSSMIRISKSSEIIKLIQYIYPKGYEFGLKRKFDKAMLIYKA